MRGVILDTNVIELMTVYYLDLAVKSEIINSNNFSRKSGLKFQLRPIHRC